MEFIIGKFVMSRDYNFWGRITKVEKGTGRIWLDYTRTTYINDPEKYDNHLYDDGWTTEDKLQPMYATVS